MSFHCRITLSFGYCYHCCTSVILLSGWQFKFLFSVSCFEDGIHFSATSADSFAGVANANVCQYLCQALSACISFVYFKSIQTCYRKTGNTGTLSLDPNAVFGPKYCSGAKSLVIVQFLSHDKYFVYHAAIKIAN